MKLPRNGYMIKYQILSWFHHWCSCLFMFYIVLFSIHYSIMIYCFFFFITSQIQFSQCTVTFHCFTYHPSSFCSNSVIYLFHLNHISDSISVLFSFLLFIIHSTFLYSFSSPLKFSVVNVLLLFNTLLIILAPEFLIWLSIYFI